MTSRVFNLIRTIAQARLAEIAASIKETPWAQAIRNVWRARRHRSSRSVAAAMLQRYSCCYFVNADFWSLPRIELAEYRTCSIDDVPLIRVGEKDIVQLIKGRRAYITTFREHGATLVVNAEVPVVTPPDVIHSIAVHGWHILTVDDARRMIEGRDIAASEHGYLSPGNYWLTTTEKDADALQIAESLFPFCEQVVATRTAMMVIYTPGLPKPLRLWRLSLKGIMPSLPPVA